MEPNLASDRTDALVSGLKGLSGAIPFAGGIVGELISQVIPGQRVDRIAAFLRDVNSRLEKLEIQRERVKSKEFVDLFEDATLQALRALSEERTQRIASFVANVAKDGGQFHSLDKRIIQILSDLTDDDIRVLSAIAKGWNRAAKLRQEIEGDALSVGQFRSLAVDDLHAYEARRAAWDAHIGALDRFGLIKPKYAISNIDLKSIATNGGPKIDSYRIAPLGKLLLLRIGVMGDAPDNG